MTDKILDSIIQHTNQYTIIQPNFGPKSDAKLTTDKTELKAFISLFLLSDESETLQGLNRMHFE